jgi:hypothetical protein
MTEGSMESSSKLVQTHNRSPTTTNSIGPKQSDKRI